MPSMLGFAVALYRISLLIHQSPVRFVTLMRSVLGIFRVEQEFKRSVREAASVSSGFSFCSVSLSKRKVEYFSL